MQLAKSDTLALTNVREANPGRGVHIVHDMTSKEWHDQVRPPLMRGEQNS